MPAWLLKDNFTTFALSHLTFSPTFFLSHKLLIEPLNTRGRIKALFFPITSIPHPMPDDLVPKNEIPRTEKREAESQHVAKRSQLRANSNGKLEAGICIKERDQLQTQDIREERRL